MKEEKDTKQIEKELDDLNIESNEFNLEKSDLPISNFDYINNLTFQNIPEIEKEKLDEDYDYYKEEMQTFINSENIEKIIYTPIYNSKLLKETLINFIDLNNYIVYFKKRKEKKSKQDDKIKDKKFRKLKNEMESESSTFYSISNTSQINNEIDFLKKRLFPKINIQNIKLKNKGKEYEIKVKNDCNIFLKYCFDKNFKIDFNPSTSIKFLYLKYEELINKNLISKNNNIYGKSENDIIVEFDLLIKDIHKDNLLKILECFKYNIIASSEIENLNNDTSYEIIGEIAQNILNQAIDKKTQISKYIDIILIDKILRKTLNNNDEFFNYYKDLNLSLNDKIFMIFTNGSYVKLLKSYKEIHYQNSRDIQNIKNLKKIIELLKENNIPYIIFYIENYAKDNIENFLINYIKLEKKPLLNDIEKVEKKIQNNLVHSYFIKSIIKKLEDNKELFYEKIIDSFILKIKNYIDTISNLLYKEIIENINHIECIKINFICLYKLKPIVLRIDKKDIEDYFNKNYLKINFKDIKIEELKNYEKKINYEKEKIIIIYESKTLTNITDIMKLLEPIFADYEIFNEDDFDNNTIINIHNKSITKYEYLVRNKIKKNINNNYIYYKDNNEYLNFNNLQNKIIYDIKNISYVFICKKNINNIEIGKLLNDKLFDEYNSNYLQYFFKKIFNENDFKIMNLNPMKLTINDESYKKLIEHLCSWIIYCHFFEKTLFKNLLD